MSNLKEENYLEEIPEMLKNSPNDDGTFKSSMDDLYFFASLVLSTDEMKNGKGISLNELDKEMEDRRAYYHRKFG